jgi:hypothetical protein
VTSLWRSLAFVVIWGAGVPIVVIVSYLFFCDTFQTTIADSTAANASAVPAPEAQQDGPTAPLG